MNLWMFVVTILLTLLIEIVTELTLLKDLADENYKLKGVKLFQFLNIFDMKMSWFYLLVPFVNLWIALERKKEADSKSFDEEYILPFSLEEKKLYQNYPNLLMALKINVHFKLEADMMLIYFKDGMENQVLFTEIDGGLRILSTKGPISLLSEKKKKQEFLSEIKEMRLEPQKEEKSYFLEKQKSYVKRYERY